MREEELPPLVVRAALYSLIWWEAIGAGGAEEPDTCSSLATLEERSTFWMDWLLAGAAQIRADAKSEDDGKKRPKVHREQVIRQSLGLGARHKSRSNEGGVVWPWIIQVQQLGAPRRLLSVAANNRLGVHVTGRVHDGWGKLADMTGAPRKATREAVKALGRGQAARDAWAELCQTHGQTVKRLLELIPADRLPPVVRQANEAEARQEQRRDEHKASVCEKGETMGSDNDVWSGLPRPGQFRLILRGCLGEEKRLYASDSFALLYGVWQLSGASLSGVFPAIHHRRDGRESLLSHLQHLAEVNRNQKSLGGGNPWVARHVAQLACVVLESGGDLSKRADWNAAFLAHRHQMKKNFPQGPDWTQRNPKDATGQDPTRARVRELARRGVARWKLNGLSSKAWLDASP